MQKGRSQFIFDLQGHGLKSFSVGVHNIICNNVINGEGLEPSERKTPAIHGTALQCTKFHDLLFIIPPETSTGDPESPCLNLPSFRRRKRSFGTLL